jgi:hypothetical protein
MGIATMRSARSAQMQMVQGLLKKGTWRQPVKEDDESERDQRSSKGGKE